VDPRARVGSTIGDRFRLLSIIGAGGMSCVYEAMDAQRSQRVAVKVLHTSSLDDPQSLEGLRHEASLVTAIGHPNICPVYELCTTGDGCPFLVMERLVGETLADRLARAGSLDIWELAPILDDVLSALGAAHQRGVVHQDLKPHNIFIAQGGDVQGPTCKLLDFGIATWMATSDGAVPGRVSGSGWVVGTPYYMAPEQARGDGSLDQRVDLWSTAVMAYEALAGRRPFVASNYHALMVQILTSHPRPLLRLRPTLPSEIAVLIDRGLAKAREDRFQTAAEFQQAVDEVMQICLDDDMHRPTLIMRRGTPKAPRAAFDDEATLVAPEMARPCPEERADGTVAGDPDEDTATTLVVPQPSRR
jgi:serine/threonine-protein kinase